MARRRMFVLTMAVLELLNLQGFAAAGRLGKTGGAWPKGKTYSFNGLEVNVSAPVLVGRSHGYFWMPTMVRLSNGELLAGISNQNGNVHDPNTELYSWSSDGGLTWSSP